MALPIAPVTLPRDLSGQTNGRLDSTLLRTVPGGGQLHHLAARAWNAMVADARKSGYDLPLTFTYGGTYRTYSQQEYLFRSRYEIGGAYGGCKVWNGQTWCKKLVNGKVPATAAVPGTSNHGWGLAIDSAYDTDVTDGLGPDDAAAITSHPGWTWLLANANKYGFSWEMQTEPWHVRYVAGDVVPWAVLTYEESLKPQPEPVPPPIPEPVPDPQPIPQPDLGEDMSTKTILIDVHTNPYGVWYVADVNTKTWVQDGNVAQQLMFRVAEAMGKPVDYTKAPPELPPSLVLSSGVAIDGHRYSVVKTGNSHVVASFGPIIGPRPPGVDEYGR